MAVVPFIELEDPISPKLIEHEIDAAWHAETRELLHCYNFLSYRFETRDGEIRARSYLDDVQNASLFLPQGMEISHPDAQRVLGYLTRRYPRVQMLGTTGYETVLPTST